MQGLKFEFQHDGLPPVDRTITVTAKIELSEALVIDGESYDEAGFRELIMSRLKERLRRKVEGVLK